MARLEDANFNLSEQLQTRKVVERAKGILQRDLGLSEEQAYLTLQRQSRQKRKPMKAIAEAIVLSDEVRENSPSLSEPNQSPEEIEGESCEKGSPYQSPTQEIIRVNRKRAAS